MAAAGEDVGRGDPVGRVDGVEVTGEGAHHRQPMPPPFGSAVGGKGGPRHGGVDGDGLVPARLHVSDELGEQSPGAVELEAQSPAEGEVVVEGVAQVAHDALPGQGSARARSPLRSTLA